MLRRDFFKGLPLGLASAAAFVVPLAQESQDTFLETDKWGGRHWFSHKEDQEYHINKFGSKTWLGVCMLCGEKWWSNDKGRKRLDHCTCTMKG